MSIEISPKSFFEQPSVADMRLIACPGAEELTKLIDQHLPELKKTPSLFPATAPASRAVMPRVWSRSLSAATISLSW